MHVTALRQRVIADGEVLGRDVVPHHEVTGAPFVPVDEFRFRALGAQLRQQIAALVLRNVEDPGRLTLVDINTLGLA